jgi:hypothetical protein
MEHVLDPGRATSKLDGESSKPDRKDVGGFIPQGNDSTPSSPVSDANKRGSRRLIAMYRHIREDCVIVGEYLCDPFLGKRLTKKRLPPPPLKLDTPSSRSSSPEKGNASQVKFSGDGLHSTNDNLTSHERREYAAISLRKTLDALISFIDARCVLIRIHADLYCSPAEVGVGSSSPNKNNQHSLESRGRKWMALADQCQITDTVSAWAKEEDCMLKGAVSIIEQELRALERILICIQYLLECE